MNTSSPSSSASSSSIDATKHNNSSPLGANDNYQANLSLSLSSTSSSSQSTNLSPKDSSTDSTLGLLCHQQIKTESNVFEAGFWPGQITSKATTYPVGALQNHYDMYSHMYNNHQNQAMYQNFGYNGQSYSSSNNNQISNYNNCNNQSSGTSKYQDYTTSYNLNHQNINHHSQHYYNNPLYNAQQSYNIGNASYMTPGAITTPVGIIQGSQSGSSSTSSSPPPARDTEFNSNNTSTGQTHSYPSSYYMQMTQQAS